MSKQRGSTRWACQVGGCPVGGCPVGGCPVGGCPVGGCPVGGCPVGYQLQGVSECVRSRLCIRLYVNGCNDCVSACQGLAVMLQGS